MVKKIGNLLVTAYLLVILMIYPFYMKNGYVEIGKAKFEFWVRVSAGTAILLIGFLLVRLVREKVIYTMDIWVLLFGIGIATSYLVSVDRKEAFFGTDGWHMGVLVYGLLVLLYFLITRLWNPGKYVYVCALAPSCVVFMLCLLDRFSIYLIPLTIRDPGFVSTLGNINWFCGYLVVFLALGAGLFVFGRRYEVLLAIFCLIGFMAGFSQGGSSVFLFFGVLGGSLLWFAAERREWLMKWSVLLGIWCLAAQTIRLMRFFLQGYNYDTDNLCGYFTGGNTTLYILLADAVFFLMISRISADREKHAKKLRILLGSAFVLLPVTFLVLGFYKTYLSGGSLESGHFLFFDDAWGNGRGAAFRVGIRLFQQMPLQNKLFGVGADCFSVYAYSTPEMMSLLEKSFAGSRLTNAHNELLTMLVNFGILGTISYFGIFISYLHGMRRSGRNPYVLATGVAVVCYVLHNMVSFANVLNLPFLFVLLAMGQKCCIITYCDRENGDMV